MTIDGIHAARRRRVLGLLGEDAALIVPASPELLVGLDAEVRYVVDPDLYYLTGYREPEALLVLCPSNDDAPYTLFVRPRDPDRELWTGMRGGPDAARELFGADAAHSIAEVSEKLPKIVAGTRRLFARLPSGRPEVDRLLLDVLARARRQRPRTGKGPLTITDHGEILSELRLRKDAQEIAAMREAARISVETFLEAARQVRPGAGEWTIEATLDGGFRARGGSGPAFPTIVAAGANATVLHYVENSCAMERGQLLLVDAGARMGMYCADITRVFPVGGAFTAEQRVLYDGVKSAHDAAIAAVTPGASVKAVHQAALRVLLETLSALALLPGSVERALEKEEDYRQYFPHRTSHWLGLDVHDVGDYVIDGDSRVLEPGMVLTIEPGLYVAANHDRLSPLAGTGVRIEDDVLVTADGHEILTAGLPSDADAVAALVQ
jgi:Xaa-Pro aminopeptidase